MAQLQYLNFAQVIVSIVLIILILLQQRGTALGSAFGQEGGFYATRRGVQQKIFWATVILGTAFIVLSLLNLIF
jgi:protein translocase SecG subunit